MAQDVKLVDKEYVGLHYPIINLVGCIYWPNHSSLFLSFSHLFWIFQATKDLKEFLYGNSN